MIVIGSLRSVQASPLPAHCQPHTASFTPPAAHADCTPPGLRPAHRLPLACGPSPTEPALTTSRMVVKEILRVIRSCQALNSGGARTSGAGAGCGGGEVRA